MVITYYNNTYYKSDWDKIRNKIRDSDLIITDGSHRIAGIKILKNRKHSAEVTYIGIRREIPFVRQLALEYGKKIITDIRFSLQIVRDCTVGEKIYFDRKVHINLEQATKNCDVIITDGKFYVVGLIFDKKKMEAPHICLMSEDINYVRQIAKKFNIPEKIDRPLARELFFDHSFGDEITCSYYSEVAKIYAKLWY